MSIDVPIFGYMKDRITQTEDTINQLRDMFTKKYPALCFKESNRWMISMAHIKLVDDFLADEVNIKVANATVQGLKMGSGSARSKPSTTVLIGGQVVPIRSNIALQSLIDDLVEENTREYNRRAALERELAEKTAPVKAVTPAAVPSMPIISSGSPEMHFRNHRGRPARRRYDRSDNKRSEKMEQLANLIAENPHIFMGARSEAETLDRLVDFLSEVNFRTVNGNLWRRKNLSHYTRYLRQRVTEIIAEKSKTHGKPRVRLKPQTA